MLFISCKYHIYVFKGSLYILLKLPRVFTFIQLCGIHPVYTLQRDFYQRTIYTALFPVWLISLKKKKKAPQFCTEWRPVVLIKLSN